MSPPFGLGSNSSSSSNSSSQSQSAIKSSSRHVLTKEERQREAKMLQELKKMQRENALLGEGPTSLASSTTTKKRLRVPQVDSERNPFCMDRQLADQYELQNYNKNPRFYSIDIKNSPRVDENPRNHSSFIGAADLIASSGFSSRVRAEFRQVAAPATHFEPTHFSIPKITTVNSNDMQVASATQSSEDEQTPSVEHLHQKYINLQSKIKPKSFGHRPQSASRMFDPFTQSVQRKGNTSKAVESPLSPAVSRKSMTMKTGMSVMQLHQLLNNNNSSSSPSGTHTPTSSQASSFRGLSLTKSRKGTGASPSASSNMPGSAFGGTGGRSSPSPFTSGSQWEQSEAEEEDPYTTTSKRQLEEREKNFDNRMYRSPSNRIKKEIRYGPPSDHTTAELIDKYRKLAVGKLPYEDA